MDGAGGGPRFPWQWLIAAVVGATVWTAVAVQNNNFEFQAIDLVHHVMFVSHLGTPWNSADEGFVGQYPLLSHRIAIVWLPLFANPIQSVRAAALTSLLVMFIAQWFLVRTVFTAAPAALATIGWQAICTSCKVGDVNHFLWDYQYNYSRAVAAAFLWLMILSFVIPAFGERRRTWNFAFGLTCASLSFLCHIAAGSLALATFAGWCIVQFARGDRRLGIAGTFAFACIVAALLHFGEGWKFLASRSTDDGGLPTRHPDLLRLWMPTWLIGLGMVTTRLWNTRKESIPLDATTAILCGLLPAGLLQFYLLYSKFYSHSVSNYAVTQMLFYTFALASLLWVVRLNITFPAFAKPYLIFAALLAVGYGFYVVLETDSRRPYYGIEHDPVAIATRLKPHRDAFLGHYYYDPQQPHGAYFATRAVLERDCPDAARYWQHTHYRDIAALIREPDLKGLFLPADEDPACIVGPACPIERIGEFWKCDIRIYRDTQAFAAFAKTLTPLAR